MCVAVWPYRPVVCSISYFNRLPVEFSCTCAWANTRCSVSFQVKMGDLSETPYCLQVWKNVVDCRYPCQPLITVLVNTGSHSPDTWVRHFLEGVLLTLRHCSFFFKLTLPLRWGCRTQQHHSPHLARVSFWTERWAWWAGLVSPCLELLRDQNRILGRNSQAAVFI